MGSRSFRVAEDDGSRQARVLRDRRLMKIMGVGRRCRVPVHAPTPGSARSFDRRNDRANPEAIDEDRALSLREIPT